MKGTRRSTSGSSRDDQGTRITIRHTGVPDGHFSYERDGWEEHYFEPMRRYFSSR